MSKLKVRVEVSLAVLCEHADDPADLFRLTIRVTNPDQTGFMSHMEVERRELGAALKTADAIARTWSPDGIGEIRPYEAQWWSRL